MYGFSDRPDTLGDYFAIWIERHPRSERTNATNEHRISRVTGVEIEGIALKDWPVVLELALRLSLDDGAEDELHAALESVG